MKCQKFLEARRTFYDRIFRFPAVPIGFEVVSFMVVDYSADSAEKAAINHLVRQLPTLPFAGTRKKPPQDMKQFVRLKAHEQAQLLSEFFTTFRRKDGTRYFNDTLNLYARSIQRYMRKIYAKLVNF